MDSEYPKLLKSFEISVPTDKTEQFFNPDISLQHVELNKFVPHFIDQEKDYSWSCQNCRENENQILDLKTLILSSLKLPIAHSNRMISKL